MPGMKSSSLRCCQTNGLKIRLQWRHNGRDGLSNHQPHDSLLNRLFRRRSKETSKFRVPGFCAGNFCAGNSPVTGEFPAQMVSNAKNVRTDVLPQDLVRSRSREIHKFRIVKSHWNLAGNSAAAPLLFKFQSEAIITTSTLAAWRFHEILR